MRVGISTSCFYPQPTEEALNTLLALGTGTLEVFFNSHSELEPAFLQRLRAAADGCGAQIVAVHPYTSGMEGLLFFSDYERRFADAREYYKRYYEAAARLGAGLVVFHGAYRQQTIPLEEYARRIDLLDGDAAALGVRLAQENVERCLSRTVEFAAALRRLRPTQKFVFDWKQAVRAQADPWQLLETMGPGLAHLHLSDHIPGCDCLPPGLGTADFGRLFRWLEARGFDGTAVIELYRRNFGGSKELVQSLAFLRSLQ